MVNQIPVSNHLLESLTLYLNAIFAKNQLQMNRSIIEERYFEKILIISDICCSNLKLRCTSATNHRTGDFLAPVCSLRPVEFQNISKAGISIIRS